MKLEASENQIHQALGEALEILRPKLKRLCVFFPVPNGSADLGAKLGARLKKMHKVHAGPSDWVFIHSVGGICIELKTEGGRQNKDQERFQEWCQRIGVHYYIARSVAEAIRILMNHGMISHKDARPFL